MDVPKAEEIDLLVIMGGPMSVNDEDQFPWLALEKHFVRAVIAAEKPVLGICLGAQVIANAMGAKVYPNREKEIGWFPVQGVHPTAGDRFAFPPSQTVFHWHGETFDLPPGAIRLATSQGCENQAFQLGKRVLGLQFHLETTPALVTELVAHCGDELVPSKYVQTAEALLSSAGPDRYTAMNGLMGRILAYLVRSDG
ncbi:type 1 glutamine amidotransferase [Desulfatitalea sp. M08but]|uniref:Type 1 glutamine amidotransferase n=2 Tax=Desulfatitalea alkaliphila TaxID=2929485 RepID=A0AA41QZA4_9BACT|nr:type 1 glutamine amidotransferase [Desulfatitalea alkaliphila]MCJ8499192.1 type 1 glutamine amidotransferase [Desulfatitalea alkaliphila]